MLTRERARDDGIDVVAIMSPNDSHYRYCVAAISAGYDVICDKPLATNLEDALDLVKRVEAAGIVFCQTFNYTGFPLVRQAMAMIRDGDIGAVRMVEAEYIQGYNYALRPDGRGRAQRHFAERTGLSLVRGTSAYAHHLVRYVTGLNVDRLVADVTTTVPAGRRRPRPCGRPLPAFEQRRRRMGTQAGAGAVHGLTIHVFGEKGGLEWCRNAQQLHCGPGASAVYERGGPGLAGGTARQQVAIGHREGYQEAFAVLYAGRRKRRRAEARHGAAWHSIPASDGAHREVHRTAVESSRDGKWVDCRLGL
jgi:predicted dehydrogenase